MPDQTSPCPASLEYQQIDNYGQVLADVRATHDGVSVRPNCDGPTVSVHIVNTGDHDWYVHLPNKKKGDPWVLIPPGTDQTISSPGQLSNLGLSTYQDCRGAGLGPNPTYG